LDLVISKEWREVFDKSRFEARFASFLAGVTDKVLENHKQYKILTPPQIGVEPGPKYIRVVKSDVAPDGTVTSRSVHCFVDRTNGNVLKAAGYRKPETKNPRSNIFDDDFGLSGVTAYGAVYLK
jgi:hypothetical protein